MHNKINLRRQALQCNSNYQNIRCLNSVVSKKHRTTWITHRFSTVSRMLGICINWTCKISRIGSVQAQGPGLLSASSHPHGVHLTGFPTAETQFTNIIISMGLRK